MSNIIYLLKVQESLSIKMDVFLFSKFNQLKFHQRVLSTCAQSQISYKFLINTSIQYIILQPSIEVKSPKLSRNLHLDI